MFAYIALVKSRLMSPRARPMEINLPVVHARKRTGVLPLRAAIVKRRSMSSYISCQRSSGTEKEPLSEKSNDKPRCLGNVCVANSWLLSKLIDT